MQSNNKNAKSVENCKVVHIIFVSVLWYALTPCRSEDNGTARRSKQANVVSMRRGSGMTAGWYKARTHLCRKIMLLMQTSVIDIDCSMQHID